MGLFKSRPKTSQQKAQKAQMGIFARLLGCGYLVYIMIQLLTTEQSEGESIDPALRIAIAVFFLAAAAVIIFITLLEFLRNYKAGLYSASAYTDDTVEGDAAYTGDSALDEPANDEGENFVDKSESDDEARPEDDNESDDEDELEDDNELESDGEDEPEDEGEAESEDSEEKT